jgi:hypothetical protein
MKQYLAVCGIAIIALAMIGTTAIEDHSYGITIKTAKSSAGRHSYI